LLGEYCSTITANLHDRLFSGPSFQCHFPCTSTYSLKTTKLTKSCTICCLCPQFKCFLIPKKKMYD
jgi:hypothetical protein